MAKPPIPTSESNLDRKSRVMSALSKDMVSEDVSVNPRNSALRNSYTRKFGTSKPIDKVISYDTKSLIDSINEEASQTKNTRIGLRLKRPLTSKNANGSKQSVNEKFNQKLI